MTDPALKTRENSLRRAAERRGLALVKAPPRRTKRKEPVETWPSRWLIVDIERAKIVSGLLLLTLEEAEAWLAD